MDHDLRANGQVVESPLFRPLSHNRNMQETRRRMDADAIDCVLLKHAVLLLRAR